MPEVQYSPVYSSNRKKFSSRSGKKTGKVPVSTKVKKLYKVIPKLRKIKKR